jgi:hypothetical protein
LFFGKNGRKTHFFNLAGGLCGQRIGPKTHARLCIVDDSKLTTIKLQGATMSKIIFSFSLVLFELFGLQLLASQQKPEEVSILKGIDIQITESNEPDICEETFE